MEIRYLQDSIVITYFRNGLMHRIREIKCGRHGLPIMMQTRTYDNRRRKKKLQIYSTLDYVYRDE